MDKAIILQALLFAAILFQQRVSEGSQAHQPQQTAAAAQRTMEAPSDAAPHTTANPAVNSAGVI